MNSEKPVKSPCVSICALNENDICQGCYRSADEISRWGKADNAERRRILNRVDGRERSVNPFANLRD